MHEFLLIQMKAFFIAVVLWLFYLARQAVKQFVLSISVYVFDIFSLTIEWLLLRMLELDLLLEFAIIVEDQESILQLQ